MSSFTLRKDFSDVPMMWEPKKDSKLLIIEFWKHISKKYGVKIDNYWDLHRWSTENIFEFWKELWDYAQIIYSRNYDKVTDPSVETSNVSAWFEGARLNYAENVLRYRDDHIAMIVDGEDKESKKISYAQLYVEVCRYGIALKELGLKKNDVVACYMSNREEAVVAMLGTTAAGAIWSGALPLMGAKAVIKRFLQVKPKFLFTVDRFVHNGEEIEMLSKLQEISNALPSLEKIIIVPSKPTSLNKDISKIKNSCFLEEFLAYGRKADGSLPALEFQQLPFNHPVFISYTSGTTGNPKALIHGMGGILNTFKIFFLHGNMTRKSIWLATSPVGWVSWNMGANMLSYGITLVLYEGIPFFLSSTSTWDMVDEYKITDLFLTPSCLDDIEKLGYFPTEKHHFSSLKVLWSGASVVKKSNYDFIYEKIKPDIFFNAAYGTSEIMGFCMVCEQTLPLYRGEISAPALGMDIRIFDDNGKAIEGESGEIVILTSFPTFLLSILNDKDGAICRNNYFNKFPGVFTPGDCGFINPVTKGYTIHGRSDETLKPRGARFGSSEIYSIVNTFSEIQDSLCVSQYNGLGDERAILFLKMKPGQIFTNELVQQVKKAIEQELTKRHVPEVILETKDIPYNLNGKKMEIVVKKLINKMPGNSTEVVLNKECLASYQDIPELQDFY